MTLTLIMYVWILASPLGYIACRWSNRVMKIGWTRTDRMYAIVGALLSGPMMAVMTLLFVLLYKVQMSDWGKKDARW